MGANIIEVIIRADDQASAKLRLLASESDSMWSKFKAAAGAAMIAVAAIIAIGYAVDRVIEVYKRYATAEIMLETRLAALGDSAAMTKTQLDALTAGEKARTLFDEPSIKTAEATLLRYANVRQDIFARALRDAGEMAAADGDIAARARMIGMAMEDPITGFRRLRMEDVQTTDAERDRLKVLMDQNKIYEAQQMIFGMIERSNRDMAERMANANFAATEKFKRHWNECLASTGHDFAWFFSQFAAGIEMMKPPAREDWGLTKDQLDQIKQLEEVEKKLGSFNLPRGQMPNLSDLSGATQEYLKQNEALAKQVDEWQRVAVITGRVIANAQDYAAGLKTPEYAKSIEEKQLTTIAQKVKVRREVEYDDRYFEQPIQGMTDKAVAAIVPLGQLKTGVDDLAKALAAVEQESGLDTLIMRLETAQSLGAKINTAFDTIDSKGVDDLALRLDTAARNGDKVAAALEDISRKSKLNQIVEVSEFVNPAGAKALEETNRAAEANNRFMDQFNYSIEDAAAAVTETLGNAFGALFDTAESRSRAWASLFRNLLGEIAAQVAKAAIWKVAVGILGFEHGGEVIRAQHGLEAVGGVPNRDTIHAAIQHGEVVVPSPTVEKLNRFMDRFAGQQQGGGISLYTLFYSGSRDEANQAGEFTNRVQRSFSKFVVEGVL